MKKSLGQHFLTNPRIHESIVAAADIKAGECVVEIGPGSGLLTDHLLTAGAQIIAIEKDSQFVIDLREKYRNNKNIEIIEADVLTFKPSNLKQIKFKLVGNLPYYLTSHLLRVVLQTWPVTECIVFMVQKEVAQRITAKSPNMNMLAVLVQTYCDVKIISKVARGNFTPIPKVDSAIVKFIPKNERSAMSDRILEIASKGFKNPRKMLGNNLSKELLERAGIDPSRRAETLTIAEWQTLASVI